MYCSMRLEVIYINIACAYQQNNILTIGLQMQTKSIDFSDEIYYYIWDCFIKKHLGSVCIFYGWDSKDLANNEYYFG